MGAVPSFLVPSDHKFSGYERSLEKIDKELQSAQARLCGLKDRKHKLQTIILALIVATVLVGAAYIAQLKISRQAVGHWDHFKHVAGAIILPLGLSAAREVVGMLFELINRMCGRHISRLEKQRNMLLKQLKEATYYDKIFNIIEKYDPEATHKGDPNPQTPSVMAATVNTPSRASHPPAAMRRGGQAMYHLFQSTGQALSPVMDKLAGMMEDDPMQAAAFRQLLQEQEILRGEVERLRAELLAAGVHPGGNASDSVVSPSRTDNEDDHRD